MNDARVDAIRNALSEMEIKLAEDPASVPPGYIQRNVAICARHSTYLSNLMMEVGKSAATAEKLVELLKAQVEIRYSEALMHNPEINKVKRTATNRAAMAKLIVADDMKELAARKAESIDLKYLMDACKRKERELKLVDQSIRLQAKVLGIELDLSKKGNGPQEEPEDDPDEPVNDALSRGDGTPVVSIEGPPDLAEDAPSELPIDSLVSGMEYDVPEVEGAPDTTAELLEKLG